MRPVGKQDRFPRDSSTGRGGALDVKMRPELAAELTDVMSQIRPIGTRVMARAFAEADLRPMLGDVEVPTLLLYGSADERAPRPVADALNAAITGSTLVVLPGLSHCSFLEEPEQVSAVLREFLRTAT